MLGLSIRLRIECTTKSQSSAQNGKQQLLESERKARVPIMGNIVRYTKESNYMRKKQLSSLWRHYGPFPHKTGDQKSKLAYLLNTHHESIEATI